MQAWPFVTTANPDLLAAAPAAALIACGIALTAGIFTPICCTLAGVAYALALLMPHSAPVLPRLDDAVLGLASVTALGLLGPGAWSIDARLFGHREIFIPAQDDSGEEQS
jgi:uncharacterized membrane protein YphA (DoxX/SURF4 family)